MNGEAIFGVFLGCCVAAVLGTGIYAIYTDEFEVKMNTQCIEYSQATGECSKHQPGWVCKNDAANGGIVAECTDVKECSDVCAKYNGVE